MKSGLDVGDIIQECPQSAAVDYVLKIHLDDPTDELRAKYDDAAKRHNDQTTSAHPDSGLDVYTPLAAVAALNEALAHSHDNALDHRYTVKTVKADMRVRAAMFRTTQDGEKTTWTPVGYHLYPRSSISKTDVRLANCVGVIDSGYRGNLTGMFDVLCRGHAAPGLLDPHHRLLQICAPGLEPFAVEIAATLDDLGATRRGAAGIGSTGTA